MKYFVGGVFCTVLALAALVAAETVVAGIYMEHEKVAALFAGKGGEIATGPGYRVSANKRTGTGQVEVHGKETNIFLIIGGEGTFVTGGKT